MDVDLIEPYAFGNVIFKNYIVLSDDDKKKILEFRNHPLVRNMMHNKEEITLTNHLDFIDKLKSDKKNCYWAVIRKNKLVGSVYLNRINSTGKSAFWGVFLSPNYMLKNNF